MRRDLARARSNNRSLSPGRSAYVNTPRNMPYRNDTGKVSRFSAENAARYASRILLSPFAARVNEPSRVFDAIRRELAGRKRLRLSSVGES